MLVLSCMSLVIIENFVKSIVIILLELDVVSKLIE